MQCRQRCGVILWNTSTRGFLPDWLHGICSADKDAVSFCDAGSSCITDRQVKYAVISLHTDPWYLFRAKRIMCSYQLPCVVNEHQSPSVVTNHQAWQQNIRCGQYSSCVCVWCVVTDLPCNWMHNTVLHLWLSRSDCDSTWCHTLCTLCTAHRQFRGCTWWSFTT